MSLLSVILSSLLFFCFCNSQGVPWTKEETLILREKIYTLCDKPGVLLNDYTKIYPDRKYLGSNSPSAPKVQNMSWLQITSSHKGRGLNYRSYA